MRKKLILFVLFLSVPFAVHAQKLTVESMAMAINDISARTTETKRYDGNREACGLIKVQLPLQGVTFEGTVIGEVANKSGEYWVYMNDGARQLRIKHPDYYPLEIYFSNYGIRKIDSLTTYILVINKPQIPVTQSKNPNAETFIVNGVSFNMIRVQGGTFKMGATKEQYSDVDKDELDKLKSGLTEHLYTYNREKPVHNVKLSTFSIGETEVTQELWEVVMGSNPSHFKGDNLPVDSVSMIDCYEFIRKLNALTGRSFRLPTEAEWEYAARGGQKSQGYKYAGGNTIVNVAWCWRNSKGKTHPVKTKQPNELGIYDMSGNVWEWCQDWFDPEGYSRKGQTDPVSIPPSSFRIKTTDPDPDLFVIRGGGWGESVWYSRISYRDNEYLKRRCDNIGLRLAL